VPQAVTLPHITQDFPCKLNNFINAYWPSYILNGSSAVYKIYYSFRINILPTFSIHEMVKLHCGAFSLLCCIYDVCLQRLKTNTNPVHDSKYAMQGLLCGQVLGSIVK
jgi:hypothetical protein